MKKLFLVGLLASTCLAAENVWDIPTLAANAKLVSSWTLVHPKQHHRLDWTWGAFYAGYTALALSDETKPYFAELSKFAKEHEYGFLHRPYHADDHCIGQTWLELAMSEDNPSAAAHVRRTFDYILANPNQSPLATWDKDGKLQRMNFERYCWCDALFMAPPVWVKLTALTGDRKYLDFADAEYRATCETLYDKDEHLFYRDARYIGKRTRNGKKVFWSRGNGWVFGGLALILRDLPPERRAFYEKLFKEMALAIKNCQREDGSWAPSLLDGEDPAMPEMSGTSFFCYGFVWGVNNGLLPEAEYLPAAKRAWDAMNKCVNEEGRLGWVQQIGDRPVSDYNENSSEVYAAGAYLLADVEIKKHLVAKGHPERLTVSIAAPKFFRPAETIELACPAKTDGLRVYSVRDGAAVPHQILGDKLLFSATVRAGVPAEYWVFCDSALPSADVSPVCFGRFAPERLDDYLWENDKTAFRVYGPAVALPPPNGEGLVSSGIDFWCKSVSHPIIDKWLKQGHYHTDSGEGLDCYSVGTTRGCGGFAVVENGASFASRNFVKACNICTGPVRTQAQIEYAPWTTPGGTTVKERRIITLDRGKRFAQHKSFFEVSKSSFKGGPGLNISAKKENAGTLALRFDEGWAANSVASAKNGGVFTAVVFPKAEGMLMSGEGDLLFTREIPNDATVVWHSGGAWSGAGQITSPEEWNACVRSFASSLSHPLEVSVK